jgi:hypothetical protein
MVIHRSRQTRLVTRVRVVLVQSNDTAPPLAIRTVAAFACGHFFSDM